MDTGSPAPEDASGRTGDEPLEHREGLQTAHKAGARSVSQKQAGSRYPDRSMPSSRKVAGAFGKEPGREPEARDQASTGSTRSNENDSEAREDDEKSS